MSKSLTQFFWHHLITTKYTNFIPASLTRNRFILPSRWQNPSLISGYDVKRNLAQSFRKQCPGFFLQEVLATTSTTAVSQGWPLRCVRTGGQSWNDPVKWGWHLFKGTSFGGLRLRWKKTMWSFWHVYCHLFFSILFWLLGDLLEGWCFESAWYMYCTYTHIYVTR